MKVSEAVETRQSVRGFLDTPVAPDVIRRVVERAARAPSGGNLQPWHIDVVAGARLAELKALMAKRVVEAPAGEPTEYDIYPKTLPSPYRDYRFEVGEALYGALGIPREEKARRLMWFARNFQFFGAPLALFCSVARTMGPPQWSDLGMYLQTVMLLLREEGLDSCPQECWAIYPKTIGEFLNLPPERMLFCGMAIGYRDPDDPANGFRAARAPLEAFARFHGL
jgi:nitroreductase